MPLESRSEFVIPLNFDGDCDVLDQVRYSDCYQREFYEEILEDAENIGWEKIRKIDLKEPATLSFVKELGEGSAHELSVKIPRNYPHDEIREWTWDLPASSDRVSRFKTLKALYSMWESEIERFLPIWEEFEILDEFCWVLDPISPRKADLYRRFVVCQGVSAHVVLSLESSSLPRVNLLGPESRTAPLRSLLREKLPSFNQNESILDNLKNILLNGKDFPRKETVNVEEYNLECGICYSYRLGEEMPNKTCDDTRCSKQFHELCLFEYLQTHPDCKRSLFTIFGKCPYCETPISCKKTC